MPSFIEDFIRIAFALLVLFIWFSWVIFQIKDIHLERRIRKGEKHEYN